MISHSSVLVLHKQGIEAVSLCRWIKKQGYQLFGAYECIYEAIIAFDDCEKMPDFIICHVGRKCARISILQARILSFLYARPVILLTSLRPKDITPLFVHMKMLVLYKPYTFVQMRRMITQITQLNSTSFT